MMEEKMKKKKNKRIGLDDKCFWIALIPCFAAYMAIIGVVFLITGISNFFVSLLFNLIMVFFGFHHFYNITATIFNGNKRVYPIYYQCLKYLKTIREVK